MADHNVNITVDPATTSANGLMSAADKTKLDGIEALADVTDAQNIGSSIHGATAKTDPVDADTIPIIDSEASNGLKKLSWANLKAKLKSYFDTLYSAAGALFQIDTGNTLWVDLVNGNDATALPDRQDLPYLTPEAARDAAGAGDIIHVRPGSYDITENLAKDGVNWHLEAGVVFLMVARADGTDMFGDRTGAKSYNITGRGLLKCDPDSEVQSHIINVTNASSKVFVEALDLVLVGTNESSTYSSAVHQSAGSLTVHCRDILGLGTSYHYVVWWADGPLQIKCRYIDCPSDSGWPILSETPNIATGEGYIEADEIKSNSIDAVAIQYGVVIGATAESTSKFWIVANKITANGTAIQKNSGGNLYVTAQKITGDVSVNQDGGDVGELYVSTQKAQWTTTSGPWELSGQKTWLNIGRIFDADGIENLITVNGGVHHMRIDSGEREYPGGIAYIEDSTLYLEGHINASADASESPLNVASGALHLSHAEIIAEATVDSIAGSGTVYSVATTANRPVASGITLHGELSLLGGTKSTPVDADTLGIFDSAASFIKKRLTWANLKATLKTYFDTLYAAATHTHVIGDTTGLQTALDGKAASSHTHPASDISDSSANGRAILTAANYAAIKALLDLEIGTDVQAFNSVLTTLAGASANGQSLITAANYAAMKALLDLEIGTDVQAYNAVLTTLAGASANGQSLVTAADYAAMRTLLSLGTAALVNTGTSSGDVPTTSQADARYQLLPTINDQSGTTYTFVLSDAGKTIRTSNGSAVTITIPTNASVAFPVGTLIRIIQGGAGQVTLSPDGGVTMNSFGSATKTAGQYASAILQKVDTNVWNLDGTVL